MQFGATVVGIVCLQGCRLYLGCCLLRHVIALVPHLVGSITREQTPAEKMMLAKLTKCRGVQVGDFQLSLAYCTPA